MHELAGKAIEAEGLTAARAVDAALALAPDATDCVTALAAVLDADELPCWHSPLLRECATCLGDQLLDPCTSRSDLAAAKRLPSESCTDSDTLHELLQLRLCRIAMPEDHACMHVQRIEIILEC